MAVLNIEYDIQKELSLEEQEVAMEFIRFLKDNHFSFIKDNGPYWKDKIYYWVKREEDSICFIAIKNPDEENNHWTVWSDDMEAEELEKDCVDNSIKETAWKYVDHCRHCGSCSGGRCKIIFGKEFADVCGCTFRIDNPMYNELSFLKTMVEIRIKEIERKSQK